MLCFIAIIPSDWGVTRQQMEILSDFASYSTRWYMVASHFAWRNAGTLHFTRWCLTSLVVVNYKMFINTQIWLLRVLKTTSHLARLHFVTSHFARYYTATSYFARRHITTSHLARLHFVTSHFARYYTGTSYFARWHITTSHFARLCVASTHFAS